MDRIDLVITAELRPGFWNSSNERQHHAPISAALESALDGFASSTAHHESMDRKIHITVAPEADILRTLIGQLVIRYEGTVPTHQCRFCSKAMFEQRPILATVGTAAVSRVPDTDLLITPANRDHHDREMHFLRPLAKFPIVPERMVFVPPDDGTKLLLTGYANDKLERGLLALGADDWDALSDLFATYPEFRWHLIGAQDIDAVWSALAPGFRKTFADRITVSGMVELEDIFEGAFAFFALPGVGGSGTTAKLAIRSNVPVLVCRNGDRDMSNMFPTPPAHREFVVIVQLLAVWADDIDKRTAFLADQIDNINGRTDLEAKAREMQNVFRRTVDIFLARKREKEVADG
ncbi:hypothetical protein HFP51_08850 [Parasphingopyxis sp. CP4]|uniref:hypothetical protein n=1 Tax=Parasphingopyxis sp. CP4 TaxID=2724527 RepID=UPI0015A09032|nr:hypothetical protein [Parasphingopyxis sp. CP4]QLC22273.1 hypothetical protein HFP51_08850 [Parasphingopyxis sp. CP4]